MTKYLDTATVFTIISDAINKVNTKNNSELRHWHTSIATLGYITEIRDVGMREKLFEVNGKVDPGEDTFEIEFSNEIFSDEYDPAIDINAGTKPSDPLKTMAEKRCIYLIEAHWEKWKKDVPIIDENFLISEARDAIKILNATKGLKLKILSYKYSFGDLTVNFTDERINTDPIEKEVVINRGFYLDEDHALDAIFFPGGMAPTNDWRKNGKLRVCGLIFYSFMYWIQGKHASLYFQLKNK